MKEFLDLLGVFLGIGTIVIGVWVLRWWVPQVAIAKMRKELEYAWKDLERKDAELADLRADFTRFRTVQAGLEAQVSGDHQELLNQSARILAYQRYIQRLETTCKKNNVSLPRRDDLLSIWGDEEGFKP